MDSKELAILCAKLADSKKATEIAILEIDERMAITDYFVICNCESERQAQSVAKEIEAALKQQKQRYSGIEGYEEGKWILMDYGDVVVHIYLSELRQYYELDDLWADSSRLEWESPTTITT